MTLIMTHISKFGIIHASDSNLSAHDKDAGESKKTFQIPFLNAGLSVAGTYSVSGTSMDKWMNDFIQSQASERNLSLDHFAHRLGAELQDKTTPVEKSHGSLVHIAGYIQANGLYHPEFWYVRNHELDPQTGEYNPITEFRVTEDFWTRDCPQNNLMNLFQEDSKNYMIYINGFAPGRISYVMLQEPMRNFLKSVWANPNWKFRPPKSLDEAKLLVELYMQVITTMFLLGSYAS